MPKNNCPLAEKEMRHNMCQGSGRRSADEHEEQLYGWVPRMGL